MLLKRWGKAMVWKWVVNNLWTDCTINDDVMRFVNDVCFWCFSQKEEGAILVYKERGIHGSGEFCRLENFLCWHIPLNPRNFLYSASQRVCLRNNEVVEHVVSYLLPAYIQNLYRRSNQIRDIINPIPKMLSVMPYAHTHSQNNPKYLWKKYHVDLYHIHFEIPIFASHHTSAVGNI